MLVEGVVTDRNGREQRAVERIDLAVPGADQPALRLDLPGRDLAAGEKFTVSIRLADGTLPANAAAPPSRLALPASPSAAIHSVPLVCQPD